MNKLNVVQGIAPQASGNATLTGATVDLSGTEKHMIAVNVGAYTDGNITVTVEHGDASNMSDAAAVTAATQIRGNLYGSAINPSGANKVYQFELLSKFKRYARVKIVIAGSTVAMGISASWITQRLKTSVASDRNVA